MDQQQLLSGDRWSVL